MTQNSSRINNGSVKLKYRLLFARNIKSLDVFLNCCTQCSQSYKRLFDESRRYFFFSDGRWRKYRDTFPPREFSISGDEFFPPAATQAPVALFMSDSRIHQTRRVARFRDVLETILLPRDCCHRTTDDSHNREILPNTKMHEKHLNR